MALLSPHADALAIAFAIWGLFVVGRGNPGAAALALAAVLFALAVGTKLTAVAAPLAAVLYLLPQQSKKAGGLALSFGLLAFGAMGLIALASQGRFLENFSALAAAGTNARFAVMAPARLLIGLLTSSVFLAFVAPLVLPLALWTVIENARTGK